MARQEPRLSERLAVLPPAPNPVADPDKVSDLVSRAVDQIGDGAADELERAADEIMAEATAKAERIRKFALAMREQTRIAAAEISEFCAKSSSVVATIQGLQEKLALDIAATAGQSADAPHRHNGTGR